MDQCVNSRHSRSRKNKILDILLTLRIGEKGANNEGQRIQIADIIQTELSPVYLYVHFS